MFTTVSGATSAAQMSPSASDLGRNADGSVTETGGGAMVSAAMTSGSTTGSCRSFAWKERVYSPAGSVLPPMVPSNWKVRACVPPGCRFQVRTAAPVASLSATRSDPAADN